MKVSVDVPVVRTVEEVVTHELEFPFYGQHPRTGAVLRIEAKMWPHQKDVPSLESLRVVEVVAKKGQVLVKETEVKAYPKVPVSIVTLVSAYSKSITAGIFVDALNTANALAAKL